MYQVRYSINITKNDIKMAKRAHKQKMYAMGYIDPIRFKIVEQYLSHFEAESVNTKDILEESLVNSIIKQDSYLKCLRNPKVLIPESFDEVCDFIGSIPDDFFKLNNTKEGENNNTEEGENIMKNIMNIVNLITHDKRSKTNANTMNNNVTDGNTIILSKDEGKICCPFLKTYIVSHIMENKVNLKMRFSEDEVKSIFAGTGTVTKLHNENGRNYQIKVTSVLPLSNEPVFMLQVRELLSDKELAEMENRDKE